jgi:hypothetical protein
MGQEPVRACVARGGWAERGWHGIQSLLFIVGKVDSGSVNIAFKRWRPNPGVNTVSERA